ncbi:hypothetical protein CDAR_426501 [Caerostris darwini]|uniref:Uncharacterized protein n=1 Tax=Caerostris darwini TaxID=1538125 RepID=A0AAV4RYP7_9ARAC|nr:hypothetical protein CDAR_426501 [Caerostris darwini]
MVEVPILGLSKILFPLPRIPQLPQGVDSEGVRGVNKGSLAVLFYAKVPFTLIIISIMSREDNIEDASLGR